MTQAANETQNRATSEKPADVLHDSWLKVTIWKNEGKKSPFYTAVPSRTYKDKDGNLQNGTSFTRIEALRLSRLLAKAYDRIAQLIAKDKLDAAAADLEAMEQENQQ